MVREKLKLKKKKINFIVSEIPVSYEQDAGIILSILSEKIGCLYRHLMVNSI